MALSITRSLGLARSLRTSCPVQAMRRSFSASVPVLARRTKSVMEENITDDEFFEFLTEKGSIADSPTLGHLMLREKRKLLHYLRLIEHEMPKLVAYRKPFIPPGSDRPVIVRTIDYQGEPHPATLKRVIVVAVDDLPLRDEDAIHKMKLLAGPRWTPHPPKDAGISDYDTWGNGYIKISSDSFPNPDMNLKWVTDALDRLIAEANDRKDTYRKVPIDLRHVYAKQRKAKKGDHLHDRMLNPVTVMDFPEEWLPQIKEEP